MRKKSNITTEHKCLICSSSFVCTTQNFSKHLKTHEVTSQEYFDRFFKKETDGKCLTCGKQTNFRSITVGYSKFCCNVCAQTNPEILAKIKKVNLEKFGTETYTQTEEYKEKVRKIRTKEWENKRTCKIEATKLETYKKKYFSEYEYLGYRESGGKFKTRDHNLKCGCGHEFWIQNQLVLIRTKAKENLCTLCNPLNNYTRPQNDFKDFLYSIIPEKEIFQNCRSVFNGEMELDLYIESQKIAFEFNGLFWHSEVNVDKNYHLRKTQRCEEKGIRLVHIWEDDWKLKRPIVESMVRNIFGKTQRTLYARKCDIKHLKYNEISSFLDENHLQGQTISTINYGLFFDSELVSVMTFSPQRLSVGGKKEDGSFELVRFCNKINTNVVGAASKLFSYFIKKINPTTIKSFADKSWSNGHLYEVLGFKKMKDSEPAYHYIVSNTRQNRFKYRKSELIRHGFDESKTEHEIMLERHIYRIYDCGNYVYVWSLNDRVEK